MQTLETPAARSQKIVAALAAGGLDTVGWQVYSVDLKKRTSHLASQ